MESRNFILHTALLGKPSQEDADAQKEFITSLAPYFIETDTFKDISEFLERVWAIWVTRWRLKLGDYPDEIALNRSMQKMKKAIKDDIRHAAAVARASYMPSLDTIVPNGRTWDQHLATCEARVGIAKSVKFMKGSKRDSTDHMSIYSSRPPSSKRQKVERSQVFYAHHAGFDEAQQALYQHGSPKIPKRLNDIDRISKSDSFKSSMFKHVSSDPAPTGSPSPQCCRCGIFTCGLEVEQYGECIQCNQCRDWSHIACHTDGRASSPLAKNLQFVCDYCIPQGLFFKFHYSNKELITARIRNARKSLINRLHVGSGALVRLNDFWFPVRILRKTDAGWIVKWWRGNKVVDAGSSLQQPFIAKIADITDSLWHQKDERRKIRLGHWKRSIDIEDAEDILLDPSSTPYDDEVDKALSPFKDTLRSLVLSDLAIPLDAIIPARDWLQSIKKPSATTLVPYSGSLSIIERAQIANWFDIHVTAKDKKLWLASIGLLPLAHAFTLYIAHKLSLHPEYKNRASEELIQLAWEHQYSDLPPRVDADVDLEALRSLERQMFEVSAEAGDASCYQWGLDAGHHQDNWYPYNSVWDLGDFKGDDSSLREIGPDFVEYAELPKPASQEEHKKPRPRPRPRLSPKKEA